MSLFKSVNVVYVYVRNWEAAKDFYSKILEWPLAYAEETVGWAEWGNENETHFAVNRWNEETEPPKAGGTIVLTVENVFQTTSALQAMGVHCDEPVVIPNVVAYGTFYDPEGNRVQFAGGSGK
jgi:predicted enzyme related to lactoylglutathione lyase